MAAAHSTLEVRRSVDDGLRDFARAVGFLRIEGFRRTESHVGTTFSVDSYRMTNRREQIVPTEKGSSELWGPQLLVESDQRRIGTGNHS